jgi:hypothetical protein
MQLRPLDSSPTCQLTKTAITLKTPPGVRAQYSTISRSVLPTLVSPLHICDKNRMG